jgi:DNA-binding NarL/FixJ family response regulator
MAISDPRIDVREAMNMTTSVPRVLIVDDQMLFRSGLAQLMGGDDRVHVVGEAGDGVEALQQVSNLKPDVVLMDLRMPNMDSIEVTRQIMAMHAGVKVVVLTSFEADHNVIEALRVGASGYILKDSQADAIVSGVLAVAAGEHVMSGAVANRLLEMLTGTTSRKDFYDGLTAREIEILSMMASGMGNKQIAYRLKITDKTVRNHVSNMYEKIHVDDRSQAVIYALRKGLVGP